MIKVQVPGKLVLSGDYAVLFGAPAVAASVNRFATIILEERVGSGLQIVALGNVQGEWSFSGPLKSCAEQMQNIPELRVAGIVLAGDSCKDVDGIRLTLDTREFGVDESEKFGLGSSAAVLVGLMAAMKCHLERPQIPDFQPFSCFWSQARDLHREFQGGRGSGIDVAVACFGGVLAFIDEVSEEIPTRVKPLVWPENLYSQVVWTGTSASTSAALQQIQKYQQSMPEIFENSLEELKVSAVLAAEAFRSSDSEQWLSAVGDQYSALARFGDATGVPIVSPPHRQIHDICARLGWAYKPSGAGIGDCGVAFSGDDEAAASLKAELQDGGFTLLDLKLGQAQPAMLINL